MAMVARPYEGLNSVSRLFSAEIEPSFFDVAKMEEYWGAHWGVNSEYGKLKAVYMHRPGEELTTMTTKDYDSERDALIGENYSYYWRGHEAPNIEKAQAQHDYFADVIRSYGAEVVYTKDNPIYLRKTVNTRDVAAAVPGGMIIMRLAPHMRRGEELVATRTLGGRGVPILHTITGTGIMEGGGVLVMDSHHVAVAHSHRCTQEGIDQLKMVLNPMDIEVIPIPVGGYAIHIDSLVSFIGPKMALINTEKLPYFFIGRLQKMGYKLIEVEPDEGWAINCFVLEPGVLCMIEGYPKTKAKLEAEGIKVIPIPWDENIRSGGGLHCGTCPLMREYV